MRAIDGSACEPARCTRLKSRAEFLHVAKGRRWHGAAMTIQAAARPVSGGAPTGAGSRFGFTVTKKVGNAVVRNRIRRRLREVVRLARPDGPAKAGHDYVVVGRVETLRTPFVTLGDELERGLLAVHGSRRRDSQRLEHRSVAASQDGSTPGLAPSGRNGAERIRPRS